MIEVHNVYKLLVIIVVDFKVIETVEVINEEVRSMDLFILYSLILIQGSFNSNRGHYHSSTVDGINQSELSSHYNKSIRSSNKLSNAQSIQIDFESGDHFIENEVPKDTFKFVISHIETATDVFIQLLSKGDKLCALTDILQDEYKQSPEKDLSSTKINQPCLVKSSDGFWYRGK